MAGAPAPVLSPEPNLSGMRLAFAETPVFWNDVDPEVADAVRGTALVFSSLGAAVDSIPFDQAAETQRLNPDGLVTSAEAYAVNRDRLENHFPSCDPLVANRMLFGKEVLAIDYIRALRDWQGLRARVYGYLRDVDALLIPTTAIPAKSLAEVSASGDSYTRINRLYLRNTVIGNVLNFCGLSVPCGFTSSGLPIGLMIYGKPHTEDVILRIGRAYQSVTDFHKRHPSLP
jgi:aspartyl-tRNA(Asn)/glutamyl-tRNA(Gln) amidotransferase subunit A